MEVATVNKAVATVARAVEATAARAAETMAEEATVAKVGSIYPFLFLR